MPARLRYQACNDTVCFAPRNAVTEWTLRVVPESAQGPPQRADVFQGIAFGKGEAPAAAPVVAVDPRSLLNPGRSRRRDESCQPRRRPRRVRRPQRAGIWRLSGAGRLPRACQRRGKRRQAARAPRRSRAAGDPAARPRRRARAEPHAVRAADDSDQPGHHRRRLQGRVPRAGLPARRRVRRGDGVRLRRARPGRHSHSGDVWNDQRVSVVQSGHRAAVRRAGARDVRPDCDRLLTLFQPLEHRRGRAAR